MYATVEAGAESNDPILSSTPMFLCGDLSPALSIFDFPFEDHDDFVFDDLLWEHQSVADREAHDQIDLSSKIGEMDRKVAEESSENGRRHRPPPLDEETTGKRPSRRDRHTKIRTAQGLRDRRMRLSFEVARSFFRLQDMLRFDKASKTIDWLLNRAKDEIKRLEGERSENNAMPSHSAGSKSMASTSECEVSGLEEATPPTKGRRIRRSRKIVLKPRPKEVRAKARERARERTNEKIMRSRKLVPEGSNYKTDAVGEESLTQCRSDSGYGWSGGVAEDEERSLPSKELSGVSHEHSLLTASKWNSFLLRSFHDPETLHTL